MIIFVYGWYDHDNLGDETYKKSFKCIWPEHEFNFSDIILDDDINKYDLCILGGGDVIRPDSLKKISKFDCPKISISVTVTNQSLTPDIHILQHIYVRDLISYQKLKEYGYNNVTYIPDISIILQGDKENGKKLIINSFKNSDSELYENIYTIVINSHLLGDFESKCRDRNMFFKMIDDIVEVIDKTSASFLFLPFSTRNPYDDRVTNGLVNSYTKFYKKNCVIYDKLSTEDSIDIISASDKIITTRFHGLIFGVGNNIPTTTISFHDKMSGFCETIKEDYIDYFGISSKELERKIKESKETNININKIKEEYREKVFFVRK